MFLYHFLIRNYFLFSAKDSSLYTIIIHHSGKLETIPHLVYSGGFVAFVDNCDPDRISIYEIILMANELGAPHVSFCWYKHPQKDFSNGLIQLIKDRDILEMTKWVPAYRVIYMYLEHDEKDGVMADCVPLNVVFPDEEGGMNEEESEHEPELSSPLGFDVVISDDEGV